MRTGKNKPEQSHDGNKPHDFFDELINHFAEQKSGKEDGHRKIRPKKSLSFVRPAMRKISQGCQRRAAGTCKSPKPEKGNRHKQPEEKSKKAIQTDETLKNTFTGKKGVGTDLIIERKLQQAGGYEKK